MKLLLHACCADCVLKFLESAKEKKFDEINVYYYNPNIHPRSEYQSRLAAIQQVLPKTVKLIIPDWRPQDYFSVVKNPDDRCSFCWRLRLSKTAEYAVKNNYSHFSSTLLTSHYQDQNIIKNVGVSLAETHKVSFYIPKNICSDLETSGFYKQFFCGCVYSLEERFEEKYH
jgi:epoxyqueuosine reductase